MGSEFDDFFNRDMKRTIHRTQRAAIALIALNAVISLTVLGFLGWVVVKVLQHFGVV